MKIINWLFPAFDELEFFVLFATFISVAVISNPLRKFLLTYLQDGNLFFLFMILTLPIVFTIATILKKRIMTRSERSFVAVTYFFNTSWLAIISLLYQNNADTDSIYERIVAGFILILLVRSVVKLIAIIVLAESDSSPLVKEFLSNRMAITQYQLPYFLLASVVIPIITFALQDIHTNHATLILVTSIYTIIILKVISKIAALFSETVVVKN